MATITKRGETYRIRVSCGYDTNGKQIMRSTTWEPDSGMSAKQIEKVLQRQTVLFEERCRSGQFLDASIKFAEKWIRDHAEKQLKAKTVARYKKLLIRINQGIGHIRLDKLQPHHIIPLKQITWYITVLPIYGNNLLAHAYKATVTSLNICLIKDIEFFNLALIRVR